MSEQNTGIPTVSLGRTALRVSRLGLGTAPIGNLYNDVPAEDARAAIRAALGAGVTLFDTAPLYGAGLSERRVGEALADAPRASYVLSTKVGRRILPDGAVVFDWTRNGILRSVEESLGRLGLDRIDIALVHDPDDHEREAIEVAFPTLIELREQGVISAVGAGMNQWEKLSRFVERHDLDCLLLAGRYTLLEQTSLPLLRQCAERGVGVMLGGVFNSGILATGAQPGAKYNYADAPLEILDRVRQIAHICAKHGVPLPHAALRFALSHPAVTTLIVGAVSPAEVVANVAGLRATVPPALWDDLQRAGLIAQLPGSA
jgi:D-threo-aldose 1-dehydrogenase